MADEDQSAEDWEKLQAAAWSLPFSITGVVTSVDDCNQSSLALRSPARAKEGSGSLQDGSNIANLHSTVAPASFSPGVNNQAPGISASSPLRQAQPRAARTPVRATGQPSQHVGTNSTPRMTQAPVESAPQDSIGKAKWRSGAGPDGYVRLPLAINQFQDIVTQFTKKTGQPITNFRTFIVDATGAYLTVGYRGERVVLIWGDGSQVLAAYTLLNTLIIQVAQQRNGTAPDWTRINSHSTFKIGVAETKEIQTVHSQKLRNASNSVPETTMCLSWPPNGPALGQCLASRRQLIDSIRLQYGVNIYTKPGVWDKLYLSGSDEHNFLKVVNSYKELWKTLSLQHETEIRVFLVEPPPPEIMRKDVIMQSYSDLVKPYLSELKLPANQAAPWERKREKAKQENKLAIVDHLERALHFVPRFHGYRQMRVKFGSLVLREYEKPNGTADPLLYLEFLDMLISTPAKGQLFPGLRLTQNQLIKRVMSAGNLLIPAGNIPLRSFPNIQPRFSASFEYKINSDEVVRIEANFTLPRGSEEFEINQIRCFKPRKTDGTGESELPMQISMVDFDRSDWQLEIKALDMLEEEDIPPDVEDVMRKLSFVWNESALSIISVPERMAKFPPGSPLTCFVEKSAIEFSVKGTNLVFELARFVRYNVANGRVLKFPDVTWGGSLFDPDWDEMLGENVEFDPSRFAQEACLSTFFPPSQGEDIDEEAQLCVFMGALHQIAHMLGSPESTVTKVLNVNVGTLF